MTTPGARYHASMSGESSDPERKLLPAKLVAIALVSAPWIFGWMALSAWIVRNGPGDPLTSLLHWMYPWTW